MSGWDAARDGPVAWTLTRGFFVAHPFCHILRGAHRSMEKLILPVRPACLSELRVNSTEQADQAMNELAWLMTCENLIDAEAEAAVEETKRAAVDRKTIDGQPFADRRAALETAITKFAEKNKAALTADGKTYRLANGEIKWRFQRATIVPADGVTIRDVVAHAVKTAKLSAPALKAVLAEYMCNSVPLDQILKLKPEIDKTALNAANLTAQQLSGLRLNRMDECDQLQLTPDPIAPPSQSAAS